jgi:hypothetical protein
VTSPNEVGANDEDHETPKEDATVGDITLGIPKYPFYMTNIHYICCIMCAGY